MTVAILHLSDIHIKSGSDPILSKARDIAACMFSSLSSASHVIIIASGDIAYSGKPEEYEHAKSFLTEIQRNIQDESNLKVSFILAPGNHDCDFDKNNEVRNMVIASLEKPESCSLDESVIDICTDVQKSFFEFRDELESGQNAKDDRLWRTTKIEVEGKTLGFDALNVSWVSKLREEPGRLFFPIERYKDTEAEKFDIRVLMVHHPTNWFSQSIYRSFRVFIRKLANIVISGHEHQGNVGIITETETESSAFVEGCALQGHRGIEKSAFNVIILDLDKGLFSSTQYELNGQ